MFPGSIAPVTRKPASRDRHDPDLARDAESEPVLLRRAVVDGGRDGRGLAAQGAGAALAVPPAAAVDHGGGPRSGSGVPLAPGLAGGPAVCGAGARPEPGDDLGPGRRRERLGRRLRPGRLGGDGPQLAGEVPALPGARDAPDALSEPDLDPPAEPARPPERQRAHLPGEPVAPGAGGEPGAGRAVTRRGAEAGV